MKNNKIYHKELGKKIHNIQKEKFSYEMRCAIIGPKEIIGLKDVRSNKAKREYSIKWISSQGVLYFISKEHCKINLGKIGMQNEERDEISKNRVKHIREIVGGEGAQSKLNTIKNYRMKAKKNYSKILNQKKEHLKYTMNVMELKSLAMKIHDSRNITPLARSDLQKLSTRKSSISNSVSRKSMFSVNMSPSNMEKKSKVKDEYYTRLAHQYNEIIDSPDKFV